MLHTKIFINMIKYWYVNTNFVNSFMAVFSNWFPLGIMRYVQNADSTYSWSIKQKLHSIFIFHFLSILKILINWYSVYYYTYIHEWWEKIQLHTKLNWTELSWTKQYNGHSMVEQALPITTTIVIIKKQNIFG